MMTPNEILTYVAVGSAGFLFGALVMLLAFLKAIGETFNE